MKIWIIFLFIIVTSVARSQPGSEFSLTVGSSSAAISNPEAAFDMSFSSLTANFPVNITNPFVSITGWNSDNNPLDTLANASVVAVSNSSLGIGGFVNSGSTPAVLNFSRTTIIPVGPFDMMFYFQPIQLQMSAVNVFVAANSGASSNIIGLSTNNIVYASFSGTQYTAALLLTNFNTLLQCLDFSCDGTTVHILVNTPPFANLADTGLSFPAPTQPMFLEKFGGLGSSGQANCVFQNFAIKTNAQVSLANKNTLLTYWITNGVFDDRTNCVFETTFRQVAGSPVDEIVGYVGTPSATNVGITNWFGGNAYEAVSNLSANINLSWGAATSNMVPFTVPQGWTLSCWTLDGGSASSPIDHQFIMGWLTPAGNPSGHGRWFVYEGSARNLHLIIQGGASGADFGESFFFPSTIGGGSTQDRLWHPSWIAVDNTNMTSFNGRWSAGRVDGASTGPWYSDDISSTAQFTMFCGGRAAEGTQCAIGHTKVYNVVKSPRTQRSDFYCPQVFAVTGHYPQHFP